MNERTAIILNTIIKEYVKSGQPVGSSVLVNKYKLDVSPATVRNEMAELEESGYILQPHTSAGRVPTEKAYLLYLKNLKEKKISETESKALHEALGQKDEMALKQVAKSLAQFSNQAVFWAFHRHNLYYTGVANLLSQPEFSQPEIIYDISAVIDRLDDVIDSIFDDIAFEPQVFVGSENPFGSMCSTILVKYKADGNIGLFGILGPMRMNYEKNISLINHIKNILNK